MSELRWTLLILGVVFIAALTWWERRRPRQAFAPRLREANLAPYGEIPHGGEPRTGERPDSPSASGPVAPEVAGGATHSREPWIGDAGLSDVVSNDMELHHDADDAHDSSTHAHAMPSAPGPLEALPTLIIPDEEACRALEAAWDEQQPEPTLIDPETSTAAEAVRASDPAETRDPAETLVHVETPGHVETAAPAASAPRAEPEIAGAEGVGAVRIVESPYGDGAAPPEPVVDWPPEESRRILALRIVAPPERFPGRALRLALAAEGFLLGKFAIFHKPDETNRAVLSAASLTRPGAFDLTTMDTQRYGGLSLFAVLPGAKTPPLAFEELLAAARNLNERLEGALQDERGGPLTPLRVASIRDSLRAEASTLRSATAHEG